MDTPYHKLNIAILDSNVEYLRNYYATHDQLFGAEESIRYIRLLFSHHSDYEVASTYSCFSYYINNSSKEISLECVEKYTHDLRTSYNNIPSLDMLIFLINLKHRNITYDALIIATKDISKFKSCIRVSTTKICNDFMAYILNNTLVDREIYFTTVNYYKNIIVLEDIISIIIPMNRYSVNLLAYLIYRVIKEDQLERLPISDIDFLVGEIVNGYAPKQLLEMLLEYTPNKIDISNYVPRSDDPIPSPFIEEV